MNQTLQGNLRYVLQNMRLQPGELAKVQADIVAQAMIEIGLMQSKIEELQNDIEKLKYRLETDLEVDE